MLRDEAIRAAERADAAGVHVELEIWPGVPHGFQVAELPARSRARGAPHPALRADARGLGRRLSRRGPP